MKTKFGRRGVAIAALAIGLTLAGGVAHATLPGSAEIINACRHNKTGVLRVPDQGNDCLRGETPLSWSSDTSPAQPTQFITRVGAFAFAEPGGHAFPQAFCHNGEQAIAGGFGGDAGLVMIGSLPLRADGAFAGDGDVAVGWQYTFRNTTAETLPVGARVTCASTA